MELQVPSSLKKEHEELHAELVQATREPGQVGEAARGVAAALHAHFEKEEEFALPPLGLLGSLAQGQISPQMSDVLAMTSRLKAELPKMLEEHQAVVAALRKLTAAAQADGKPQYVRFGEKLSLHARTEEEVLYPTAILIGEYLGLKLGKEPARPGKRTFRQIG